MRIDYHAHFIERAHFGPDFTRDWDEQCGLGAWPEVSAEDFDRAMEPFDKVLVFGITAHAMGVFTPHEHVARLVARNPAKYIGFMALDPSRTDAIREMERGVREFGFRGIKLYPIMSVYNIADPAFHPFYQRAVELGLPVMMHMGASPVSRGPLKYSLPLLVDDLAIAFPKLRVIIAHLGHPWQRETALVIRKHPNVYADISGIWHRPWHGYEAMITCLEWDVTHKLLFGSDYPLWEPQAAIEGLRRLNDQVQGTPLPKIPPDVVEAILERNVLNELGIITGSD